MKRKRAAAVGRPRPERVLRLALDRAAVIAEEHPDVVAVGLGFKHARGNDYGANLRHAVKFFVGRKLRKPPRGRELPRTVTVDHEGRSYRVAVDVETMGRTSQQAAPACWLTGSAARGTPGVLLRTEDGRGFLVTAGHVLRTNSDRVPEQSTLRVESGGGSAASGRVIWSMTYRRDGNRHLRDFGVVRLPERLPSALSGYPWSRITGTASLNDTWARHCAGTPQVYLLAGAKGGSQVILDTVLFRPTYFPELGLTYAPTLLYLRALTGKFRAGDSGAVLIEGGLGDAVGIHVLGRGKESDVGWALHLEGVLTILAEELGDALGIYPSDEG